MKRSLLGTIAALLLVLATAVPAAAVATPSRAFAFSWTGVDGFDPSASGCPAGAMVRYTGTGHGDADHLGLTTVSMTHCTWVNATSPDGFYRDVLATDGIVLTAANGDQLFLADGGTFSLVPNPTPGAMPPFVSAVSEITWTVAGGTGRFEGATGSGTGVSYDDMLAGIQQFHLTGTLSY